MYRFLRKRRVEIKSMAWFYLSLDPGFLIEISDSVLNPEPNLSDPRVSSVLNIKAER